jgi:hypothetical protein
LFEKDDWIVEIWRWTQKLWGRTPPEVSARVGGTVTRYWQVITEPKGSTHHEHGQPDGLGRVRD